MCLFCLLTILCISSIIITNNCDIIIQPTWSLMDLDRDEDALSSDCEADIVNDCEVSQLLTIVTQDKML